VFRLDDLRRNYDGPRGGVSAFLVANLESTHPTPAGARDTRSRQVRRESLLQALQRLLHHHGAQLPKPRRVSEQPFVKKSRFIGTLLDAPGLRVTFVFVVLSLRLSCFASSSKPLRPKSSVFVFSLSQ
jgi:hypothetical protein